MDDGLVTGISYRRVGVFEKRTTGRQQSQQLKVRRSRELNKTDGMWEEHEESMER